MKKIIILQIKGKSVGGVWFVNKTLGEEFLNHGYDVDIVSIRDNQNNIKQDYNSKLNVFTINTKDLWEIKRKGDVLKEFLNLRFINGFKMMLKSIKDNHKLMIDYKILSDYIIKNDPEYIIASHYQILDAIPKSFLKKTIFVQHSSFTDVLKYRVAPKKIKKYNSKIGKIVWLSKKTCNDAINYGITNSTYIYNPVRFSSNSVSDTCNNKTLVTIARLDSKEKQIDLMIKIVDKLFKQNEYNDWCLKLYGTGILSDETMGIINSNDRIQLMGRTDNPKEVLLNSSIYLSTSYTEGFSMSILEAYECGVPVIAYDFGESCNEQIINGKTGYIIPFDNEEEFIKKLEELMCNEEKLKNFSVNSKNFSINFNVETIIQKWLKLFKTIDEGVSNGKN